MYRVIIYGYSACIAVISAIPLPPQADTAFPFVDKIVHAVLYVLLAITAVNWYVVRNRKKPYVSAFVYAVGFGICMECMQYFLPYRSFDVWDICANTCGSLLGLWIVRSHAALAQPQTLPHMLENSRRAYSSRTALIFGARTVTYTELSYHSRRLSAVLAEYGVGRQESVAVWLSNCPEFAYSFFGITGLGAVVVPINTMFQIDEAKFIIRDSKSRVLITSSDKLDAAHALLLHSGMLEHVICVSCHSNALNVYDFYDVLAQTVPFETIRCRPDDVAQIVYTSGTTGTPKGASLTHANILSNVRDCRRAVGVWPRDGVLCILPLFHVFSSTVCLFLPIYCGARVVMMRSMKPFKRVIRTIFNNRVTIFVGVPAMFKLLAQAPIPIWQVIISWFINPIRICVSGAAALPPEVWRQFRGRFMRPIIQGYGLTEASPVVALNTSSNPLKADSVGKPVASVSIRIVDEAGKDQAQGLVGQLLVKGPGVMKGYYHMPYETAETIQNDWLYTGDLARTDAEGFLYIAGRLKEMINVGGLNVYPREVEDLLCRMPAIKEAAVVGVPHHLKGEAPVAFIVKAGIVDEQEIMRVLRRRLAPYKVPLRLFFKDDLPKNSMNKIIKSALQKEAREALYEHQAF